MVDFECLEKVEGGKAGHDLVLFALSTCGWCRKARDFLEGNDVEYRYVYVDLLPQGEERDRVIALIKEWNPRVTFPTLVIDDKESVTGFDESSYKEKLT